MKYKNRNLAAIILAAGRGKRMKVGNINKASLLLNNKPIVYYPVTLLKNLKIDPIFVVVGHARQSVQKALKDHQVKFVHQTTPFGTGHAVRIAMKQVPPGITDVIILYADDAYVYTEDLLNKIINLHFERNAMLTFLTVTVDDPSGLGRIIRNQAGEVTGIIEEKDAAPRQREIKEINPNCYIFKSQFLREYLPKLPQSPVTGEYYLPSLIKLGYDNKEKAQVAEAGHIPWRGINTQEDLEEARGLLGGGRLSLTKP